jgi:hypothetical protein
MESYQATGSADKSPRDPPENCASQKSADAAAENPLLAAALGYARHGWRVIPLHWVEGTACSCGDAECWSLGKHPRTAHGLKDGTVEEATIRSWWQRWPQANVGVVTGPESGIWMLGPDGEAGIEALAGLEGKNGPLPATPRERSGSGGRHYVFAWPAEGTVSNRKNHLGLPIDIRGAGGYFVAAPSANGRGAYAWEVPLDEVEPQSAPEWVLAWVRDDGKAKHAPPPGGGKRFRMPSGPDIRERAIAYIAKCPGAVSGRKGHDQLLNVARAVVYGFDLGPQVGFELLKTYYNPRCEPPWSDKELLHKCEEADTVPYGKPRGWLLNERDPSPPDPPPDEPEGGVFVTHLAKDIILAHFRRFYQPVFRRGEAVYSQSLGQEVRRSHACNGADSELIDALAGAEDAPHDADGTVKRPSLPGLFRKWAPTAWADLWKSLPEEDATAGEVADAAADEFKAKVSGALYRMVTLAHKVDVVRVIDGKQKTVRETQQEHRSLIAWCDLLAAPGKWESIRSYLIWCRRVDGQLRVAVRPEVFRQVCADLGSTQRRFAKLAECYGLGTGQECRAGGARAVELTPEFVAELLDAPQLTEGSEFPDSASRTRGGIPSTEEDNAYAATT